MKKTGIIFSLLLIPSIAGAYDTNDTANISFENKPINWSLAALSDTLKSLFHHHCTTKEPEIVELSDYIYKTNPTASLAQIKDACLKQADALKTPLFYYETKNGDACPTDGQQRAGYTQKSGKSANVQSCEYYINLLIEKQNEYVNKYAGIIDKKTGLFVKKIGDEFGGAYQIIDYISDGYDKSKSDVYVIKDDNTTEMLNKKILHGELAVNIKTSGASMGINEKSYIFPNHDVTKKMLQLCQQILNPAAMLAHQAPELKGSLTLDVKQMFCGNRTARPDWKTKIADILGADFIWNNIESMRYHDQTVEQCHANMVLFQNELVTFDYLGHWLFGCMRQINAGNGDGVISKTATKAVTYAYDKFAAIDQQSDSGKAGAQAQDDGVLKAYQDEGSKDAKEMLAFYNTQTSTPEKAIELVKDRLVFVRFITNKNQIENCWTSGCKKIAGSQDYVSCRANGKIYQYEFNDICNTFGDKNVPQHGAGRHF